MGRPFTWKEAPCVVSPWESIVSSLCEGFCVLCLRITAHCEAPNQPLAHLLCIMSDYCQSRSPARGARSELGLLTAAELSDLSSSRASVSPGAGRRGDPGLTPLCGERPGRTKAPPNTCGRGCVWMRTGTLYRRETILNSSPGSFRCARVWRKKMFSGPATLTHSA